MSSLEGDMKILPIQKIHVAREKIFWVEQIFMSPDLLGNLKLLIIPKAEAQGYTEQIIVPWDMMSGGRHEDLFPTHLTSCLHCRISYMRYDKLYYQVTAAVSENSIDWQKYIIES